MGRELVQRSRGGKSKNHGKLKNVILFGFEGENKTEKIYFQNFQGRNKPYNIDFAYGNDTDPLQIVNNLIKYMEDKDIKTKYGDKIFCVFDSDVDIKKQERIDKAYKKAKKYGINFIMSVPSFEIWYLLHFKKTTHYFDKNENLIKALKKFIPDYEKSENVFKIINDDVDKAIKNAKELKKFHEIEENKTTKDIKYNPSTDIYKVVEYINSLK